MKNKKFKINANRFFIPAGVFSKTYCFPNDVNMAVICDPSKNAFVTLDGVAARAWQTIFDDKGSINGALKQLTKSHPFDDGEAKSVLCGIVAQVESLLLEPSKETSKDILAFVRKHHVFYELTVELTYRCNEKCAHCYCPSGEKGKEIDVKTFKKLIDEFESLGGFRLGLTGGEMLVRDDIEDLFKVLVGRNIVVDINSNLTLLDDSKLDLISKLRPLSVGVTIHSANPKIHDSITHVKGSFVRTVDAIKKLRKKGISVLIKNVLFSETINSYKGIKKLADDLDASVDFSFKILPKLGPSSGDSQDVKLTDKKRIFKVFADLGYLTKKPKAFIKQRKYFCGAGQQGLAISPHGDVKTCIQVVDDIGKYPDKQLVEIWNSSALKKVLSRLEIKNFKKCSTCPYLGVCGACVGSWKKKNEPDSYTCLLTKLRCKN